MAQLGEDHAHDCPSCGTAWVHRPAPEIGCCLYVGNAIPCDACAGEAEA